jgi:hypothetical protein
MNGRFDFNLIIKAMERLEKLIHITIFFMTTFNGAVKIFEAIKWFAVFLIPFVVASEVSEVHSIKQASHFIAVYCRPAGE